jgi:hypothetical protein
MMFIFVDFAKFRCHEEPLRTTTPLPVKHESLALLKTFSNIIAFYPDVEKEFQNFVCDETISPD